MVCQRLKQKNPFEGFFCFMSLQNRDEHVVSIPRWGMRVVCRGCRGEAKLLGSLGDGEDTVRFEPGGFVGFDDASLGGFVE